MAANKHYIGQLDRRIELVQYSIVKSSTGSPEKTETSLGNFWAKLQDLSGNEEVDGRVISLNVRKYVMQYQSQLVQDGVKFYLKDEDGEYNIHHVAHIGRKEYLELKTSKRE